MGTTPTVVDLFAGAGGLALGFVRAGFEIVDSVEHNADPAETYNDNIHAIPYTSQSHERARVRDMKVTIARHRS